jgi:hypothetical protein
MPAYEGCIMNTYPFSIYKRANRSCYSVSFKDNNGKYLRPVSTGKKTENEALQAAFQMLRDGIPQKKAAIPVNALSLNDVVRKLKGDDEAQTLLAELKRLDYVKSYVQSKSLGAVDFITFLDVFWDWESSPYTKEKPRYT